VNKVFSDVAETYDLMNDLMSFGMHRLWKEKLIRKISPSPNIKLIDVASGTGNEFAVGIFEFFWKKKNIF
jgi:ubiquinone/menaquinone biosynthesis C-methylase UbiE